MHSMAIKILQYDDNEQVINTIQSIGHVEDFTINPDDRAELVQIIDGVTITDGGRYPAGDKYSMTAVFSQADYQKLVNIWNTRDIVDVEFEDGTTLQYAFMLIRSVQYYDKLMPNYKKIQLEFWKDADFTAEEP